MLREVLANSLLITAFVFIMMLVIEYLNVLTRGRWDRAVSRSPVGQNLLAAGLGAVPGCLGSFAVVSLYLHRVMTLGALTAAMIATSGDEAFVMLALFPGRALLLFAILLATGLLVGLVTDILFKQRRTRSVAALEAYRPAHEEIPSCVPFSRRMVWEQWRRCSPHRGWLALFLALFVAGVAGGALKHRHLGVPQPAAACEEHGAGHAQAAVEEHDHDHDHAHGHGEWDWARRTMLLLGLVGLLIVVTVPDHFLDEHLWHHLVRVHAWRIFLWTLGALLVTHWLLHGLDVRALVTAHRLPVLLLACLVGLIPESGPHLVFVTLYAQGAIPFSTLVAGSIVQDGHGMLPLLAHSRRAFVVVKLINLAVGLAVGLLGVLTGW